MAHSTPDGPQEEEYPIIEEGTVIEFPTSEVVIHVTGMYADEEGEVQLSIREVYPFDDNHTSITLDDMYDRLDFEPYTVK